MDEGFPNRGERAALLLLARGLMVTLTVFAFVAAFTGEPNIVIPDLLLAGCAAMWASDIKAKSRG